MLERFLDALWTQKCLACNQLCGLETFCFYCKPSVRVLESEACFAFSGAIRTAIQQAKFFPNESKARRLVKIIPPFEKEGLGGIFDPQGIVFVPIHWRRRLKRGFDLSALFALALSKQLKIPVLDWLQNTRFDTPLTLAKSREERIKLTQDRYLLRKSFPKKRLLLVDDVITTGATLYSAKQVLEEAGHEVTCYALAKTPFQN